MTLQGASEAIERIAESGIKSPFTFWVLLSVTLLGLIMAAGSFWLLSIQLDTSQDRYNRLFAVMESASVASDARELKMIAELQVTRREYSENLQAVVQMLISESPTKMDEQARADFLSRVQTNQKALAEIRENQSQIRMQLESIRVHMNGKSGR